jgi:hypothetical protein
LFLLTPFPLFENGTLSFIIAAKDPVATDGGAPLLDALNFDSFGEEFKAASAATEEDVEADVAEEDDLPDKSVAPDTDMMSPTSSPFLLYLEMKSEAVACELRCSPGSNVGPSSSF